jgi:hypothetical protein
LVCQFFTELLKGNILVLEGFKALTGKRRNSEAMFDTLTVLTVGILDKGTMHNHWLSSSSLLSVSSLLSPVVVVVPSSIPIFLGLRYTVCTKK